MTLSPRSMRLLALASVSFAAVIAACSSSSTEEVLATDAGSDSSLLPDSGGSPDTGSVGFDAGTTETSTVIDAGPQYDAGAPVVLDGGAGNDGGIPCVQGGVAEIEPNQAAGQATPFTTSICGVIESAGGANDAAAVPDAALGAESDFATYTLKSTTSSFYVQFSGDITLVITVDGQTVTLTPTSFPAIPFVKGKPYIVEVKANTSAKTFWRVSLFES